MKEKLKKVLLFISNPRLLLCFGVAWMITNGWCYVFCVLGPLLNIGWMTAMGVAYAAFLWFPATPEKIVTFAITIALLRWWFPNDQKTLAVMRNGYEKLKAALVRKKQERKEKKRQKKMDKDD